MKKLWSETFARDVERAGLYIIAATPFAYGIQTSAEVSARL